MLPIIAFVVAIKWRFTSYDTHLAALALKLLEQRNNCLWRRIEKRPKSDPATNQFDSATNQFPIAHSKYFTDYQSDISQNIMGSTNGQSCVNERAQGHSAGVNGMVGHLMALLSTLEAHNTQQKQISSCYMDEEVNSHPAIGRAVESSNDMTIFERRDDRVSVNQ